MALSVDQLAYVRSEIGSATPPTDADLDASYDRLGTPEAVVLEVVRGRVASLLADPASFSVEGYSQSTSANIDALSKQADRIAKAVHSEGGVPAVTTSQLVRTSPGR